MTEVSYRDECALQFHALGCVVLPMHYPVGDHCSCRAAATCASPAKHPASSWRAVTSQSRDELLAVLGAYPKHNLGAKLRGTGLVVLDVDPRSAGEQALASYEEQRSESLPETVTVTTSAGGRHLYYRLPGDAAAPRQVVRWLHGVDARSDGVIVIPPSVGMNLGQYAFAGSSATSPAALPGDILLRLTAVPKQSSRERRPHRNVAHIGALGSGRRMIRRDAWGNVVHEGQLISAPGVGHVRVWRLARSFDGRGVVLADYNGNVIRFLTSEVVTVRTAQR